MFRLTGQQVSANVGGGSRRLDLGFCDDEHRKLTNCVLVTKRRGPTSLWVVSDVAGQGYFALPNVDPPTLGSVASRKCAIWGIT